jgi:hypothetical protein
MVCPALFTLSFVLLILVELLTSTAYTFFCFVDIGGIVDQHCLHFLNINKTKERVNSDGQQFH